MNQIKINCQPRMSTRLNQMSKDILQKDYSSSLQKLEELFCEKYIDFEVQKLKIYGLKVKETYQIYSGITNKLKKMSQQRASKFRIFRCIKRIKNQQI